jgi:ribonuclease/clavin/mitogillin
VNPATPAASVLLTRAPGSVEVFLVRRSPLLRFFGGYWAFPGGRIDPTDSNVLADSRRAGAARELFEETGILLARRADDSFPPAGPELPALRRQVVAGQLSFHQLLGRLELHLHAADFRQVGSITTPPFLATRFDTSFFVAHLPAGQSPEVWPGELDEGRWASAADMLASWTRGECFLSPPTVTILEAIRGRAVDEAPARLRELLAELEAGAIHPIAFAPQVLLVPLHTTALPPAAYTNAYLVGRDPAYLLDPGAAAPAEQQRLFALLDRRVEAGLRLAAVVLSHQHGDHVGAAAACAQRYRLPILAHARTEEALAGRVAVTGSLQDGARLDLGRRPDDGGPWHLEAVFTPGHAAGHLAFYEPSYGLLFAGDMISTLSSVVIAPPEGDLATYLASLHRLRELDCRLLLPGHGPPSKTPRQTIEEALVHRAKREAQLLAALGVVPRTVAEMLPELYKGTPAALMRLAEYQLLAGLRKLEQEGRVEQAGAGPTAGWRLCP